MCLRVDDRALANGAAVLRLAFANRAWVKASRIVRTPAQFLDPFERDWGAPSQGAPSKRCEVQDGVEPHHACSGVVAGPGGKGAIAAPARLRRGIATSA